MEQLTLQELKEIEFDLLKKFRSFCEENGIRYFLAYGTLLGAIRYKGFIPWDDDVDVLVPREDYGKLISLFKDSEQYQLFSYERNKNYCYPFAKLCNMSTRKVEFNIDNGIELGVDMDIFPLDHWDDDFEKAKNEAKCIKRNIFYLGLSKYNKVDADNLLKRFVKGCLIFITKLFGSKHFINKIEKVTWKNNQNESRYIGAKSWCVYGERGIIPKEAFSKAIEIEFEGEKFLAPVGYDTYLTCLYGDYLPEPPKEKQKTHHNFTAYRLSNK